MPHDDMTILRAYQELNTTLLAYQKPNDETGAKFRLPDMYPGGYRRERERFGEHDALWRAFVQNRPQEGWLECQSWQGLFTDAWPEQLPANWGRLLAAEAIVDEKTSLTVSADGRGGWILGRVTHDPQASGLWDEVRHLAHDKTRGSLVYRRYWRFDPEQGYVQVMAAFRGFDPARHDLTDTNDGGTVS